MFKDLFSLEGRIAVVTGGSRGVGKMIASAFLAQGAAKVYITARKAGPCEATAKELTAAHDGECIALPIDISGTNDDNPFDMHGWTRAAATTPGHWASADWTVTSAATSPRGSSTMAARRRMGVPLAFGGQHRFPCLLAGQHGQRRPVHAAHLIKSPGQLALATQRLTQQ